MSPVGYEDPLVGAQLQSRDATYELLAVIGAGGMGVVYKARHLDQDRVVALKLLAHHLQADAQARRRFHREIEMIASVDHQHVVAYIDAGVDAHGQLFFTMDFVDGPNLENELDRGPLSPSRVLRLAAQLGSALDHLHTRNLIHRDVKPANVMLEHADTPDERCVLTDFGIARLVDSTTVMTQGIGTLKYMAPEVLMNHDPSPASDQYSLAAMIYRMLAGEDLYESYPYGPLNGSLPDFERTVPSVSRAVRLGIAKALSARPEDRFSTVREFIDALSAPELGPLSRQVKTHAAIAEILERHGGSMLLHELTDELNAELGLTPPLTTVQVMGRVRTYPHLFKWRQDRIWVLS